MTTHQKVFGIGLNKTGTSTLKHSFIALRILPVASPSSSDYNARLLSSQIIDHDDYEASLKIAENFSAFEDRPWNVRLMYRHLDLRFKESKFILTERSSESWWRSTHRWITVSKPQMAGLYQKHLQSKSLKKADMMDAYQSYNAEVKEYFRDSNKLLVMDFENGDGWQKICDFLDKPVPDLPFPHANKQAYSQIDKFSQKLNKQKQKGLICNHCGSKLGEIGKTKNVKKVTRKFVLDNVSNGALRRFTDKLNIKALGSKTKRLNVIKKKYPNMNLDDLAIVTCFFNPARYNSRIDNYNTFQRGIADIGVKLLTVELAFDEQDFQLGDDIGEVIRLRSSHIMWQKERLLNIGIAELLRLGYKKIAWLDCDIVFDDTQEWPWYVAAELEETSICQVFSHARVAIDGNGNSQPAWGAIKYYSDTGNTLNQTITHPGLRHPIGRPVGLTGLGWAARSEVFRNVLLYDRAILGGADKMIYAASFKSLVEKGHLDKLTRSHYKCHNCGTSNESEPYREHYQEWAKKWCVSVKGNPTFVYASIRDCYHGNRQLRGYMKRREILFAHKYDPYNDIALDKNGCWKWTSDKPELHQAIANYFLNRREDQ